MRVGDEVELVGQRAGTQPAALGPLLVQEGVAQRTQEVAEVVLVAKQARAGEQARVGLLDEILGILARAAERPGGPVEPVEVVSEPGGVERALHRDGLRRPVRPGEHRAASPTAVSHARPCSFVSAKTPLAAVMSYSPVGRCSS